MLPRPSLFVALATLFCLVACDPGSGNTPEVSDASRAAAPPRTDAFTSTIHFIEIFRIQGLAEGIPCLPDGHSPLATAVRRRDELRAAGEHAFLICLGDTLFPSFMDRASWPLNRALRTRASVILEAMGEANVDMYVPGMADLALDPHWLLDQCAKLGIPVVMTNLDFEHRDDIRQYLIFEADGLRIGALGVTRGNDISSPDVIPRRPDAAADLVTAELAANGATDFNIVFSNVSQAQVLKLVKAQSVHAVVGTMGRKEGAAGVMFRDGAAYMLVAPDGREVGETTIRVVNGDMELTNVSNLHSLPGLIDQAERELNGYKQLFGTEDLEELTQLAQPTRPDYFFHQAEMIEQNKAVVDELRAFTGSAIDHRGVPPRALFEDPGVLERLARIGARVELALAQEGLNPVREIEPQRSVTPTEACIECHSDQFDFWSGTAHARAYDTIVDRGHGFDAACIDCHTTGFEEDGGYSDPRLAAPFGPVSCWECHRTTWPHYGTAWRVVDPQYVSNVAEYMQCDNCHTDERSPDFDRWDVMAQVTCPPMVASEPPLLAARQKALNIIEGRLERGEGRAEDPYLKARALVGLGRVREGTDLMLALSQQGMDARLVVESAKLLDEAGASEAALTILKTFLRTNTSEVVINDEYARILLEARRAEARNPAEALRHLRFLLQDIGEDEEAAALGFRVRLVHALFETGQQKEAKTLLRELARENRDDHRVERTWRRYMESSSSSSGKSDGR
jgi:hypothetical protein